MSVGNKGEVRVEEPDHRERTIIRRSAESRATVPDLDISSEVDLAAALSLAGSRVAALIKACALGLRETPRANASYRDGHFELYSRVNVAVSSGGHDPGGAPVVFDADQKSLQEIDAELTALERRSSAEGLSAPERAGATFTLLDAEQLGITSATPLVLPPHAAALAAGASREVPTVRDGALACRPVGVLALAFDQRILSLALAARFMSRVKAYLEDASGALAL